MITKRYSGVVVKHNDKILLCKRNPFGSFPNMWSIPGGKIEDGENSKDAAVREFFEEMNISLNENLLEFTGVIPVFKKTLNEVKTMMYVYLYQSSSFLIPDLKNAVDGHEHTDWVYVTEQQLFQYNLGKRLENLLKKILHKN